MTVSDTMKMALTQNICGRLPKPLHLVHTMIRPVTQRTATPVAETFESIGPSPRSTLASSAGSASARRMMMALAKPPAAPSIRPTKCRNRSASFILGPLANVFP